MERVQVRSKRDPNNVREVSARDAKILVKLGRFEYLTTALKAGPPERTAPPPADPLEGIPFASPAAHDAALEAGLTPASFQGLTGSGRDGAFTKPDVADIVAVKQRQD